MLMTWNFNFKFEKVNDLKKLPLKKNSVLIKPAEQFYEDICTGHFYAAFYDKRSKQVTYTKAASNSLRGAMKNNCSENLGDFQQKHLCWDKTILKFQEQLLCRTFFKCCFQSLYLSCFVLTRLN